MKHVPHLAEAVAVSDGLLVETRQAYADDDFEAFLACFHLPQIISTFDQTRRLDTPEDLRAVFDAMRRHHREIGAIDIKRRTISARFHAPDVVEATSVSSFLLSDFTQTEETAVHNWLRYVDHRWKISDSSYATPTGDSGIALLNALSTQATPEPVR